MDVENEYEGCPCPICNQIISSLDHNNTVIHRFYFRIWQYNQYRKALLKDRHGITLDVKPKHENNSFCVFKNLGGKYVVKITQKQLNLQKRQIKFNCSIKNTRREPIYIINIYLAHPYPYFKITCSKGFGVEDTFVKLLPGAQYKFKVVFNSDVLTSASYKIPLCCDFQTVDNKYSFTTARSFLVIVSDKIPKYELKSKSPFTSKPWRDVTKTIQADKEYGFPEPYRIPVKYNKLLSYGLEQFEGMTNGDVSNMHVLKQRVRKLTIGNYANFWHVLLWMEERAQSLMLMKYNMERVTVAIKRDVIMLEVPGLGEKRPSVIQGDYISFRISGDHTAYRGLVSAITEKTVEIMHVNKEFLDYVRVNPKMELDVSFSMGRMCFERMHQAVDEIGSGVLVMKLFLPDSINIRPTTARELLDSEYHSVSVSNNADQKKAVYRILNCVHRFPYIVFGPPGTGKTITIVETILQLTRRTNKRILVCAPSNSACDMLAIKLMEYCSKEELIRIHSKTRDRITITEELKEYSNIDDGDEFTKINAQTLLKYRIVVATLNLIGRFSNDYHPEWVFVDEAAQASEPETAIAFALVEGDKRLVLAGDPKQLGPMVTGRASELGLGVSLLERLMNYEPYKLDPKTESYDSNFITMLKQNFRSHPQILHIPNKLFYNNLLQAKSRMAQHDPIVNIALYPIMTHENVLNELGSAVEFCAVSAKERREGASPSYFNTFEAEVIVKYVETLMRLPIRGHEVREDQIGVVTPYKRQVHKIKEGLALAGFERVEVGTTETFQGREKRIIIISTVRAQHSLLLHDRKYNLGFVKHDQRFNVAITRAISKLIVVGCPLVLYTDHKWAELIELCKESGTYFGNTIQRTDEMFMAEVVQRMKGFRAIDDQFHR